MVKNEHAKMKTNCWDGNFLDGIILEDVIYLIFLYNLFHSKMVNLVISDSLIFKTLDCLLF